MSGNDYFSLIINKSFYPFPKCCFIYLFIFFINVWILKAQHVTSVTMKRNKKHTCAFSLIRSLQINNCRVFIR